MKIKRLYINNYKSLVNFELIEPNPFSVFVGPNAAGKSNIFEALEFLSYWFENQAIASDIFKGPSNFINKQSAAQKGNRKSLELDIIFDDSNLRRLITFRKKEGQLENGFVSEHYEVLSSTDIHSLEEQKERVKLKTVEYRKEFSRIFIKNHDLVKLKTNSSDKLRIDAENLENVLYRILQNEIKRDEITEWIEALIPEFEKIEVHKSELSGEHYLRIFEKYMAEPIGKDLISDGTYNILALLASVYQSDKPQFLCIEEPENGLNPYVIRELVGFFRQLCKEKGHYIWLNTHSATLVKELHPKELILINKIKGETKATQLDKDLNFKSMPLDEAWLTNTLGGGIPW